ncbi:MAG: hypothetical protein PUP92_34190 [Rhizonema sp. PD38]|nr:hypothetical protein [Rhizonema sp. PD38]
MNENMLLFEGIGHTISVTDSPVSGKWSQFSVEAIALENPPTVDKNPSQSGKIYPSFVKEVTSNFLNLSHRKAFGLRDHVRSL